MNLISIEFYKLMKQKQTLIMLGLLIIGTIALAVFNVLTQDETDIGEHWVQYLEQDSASRLEQNQQLPESSLAYQNNLESIQINKYRIEHNISPDNRRNIWTFVEGAKPLISFIGIFVVIIAAGIVSSEFGNGTIKLMMTRPISTAKFIAAKYINVLFVNFLMIFGLFIFSCLIGFAFFGTDGSQTYLFSAHDQVKEVSYPFYLLRSYLFLGVDLAIFSTLAFSISVLLRNNAIALAITLFFYFTGNIMTRIIAMKYEWAKYILFANSNFNLYVQGEQIIQDMTPAFSIIICSIYLIFMLGVSYITFNKRDIVN